MQQKLTASLSATPDEKLYRALQTRKLAAIVATMPWRWCLVVCRYLDLANLVPNLPYATTVPVREIGVSVSAVVVGARGLSEPSAVASPYSAIV